MSERRSTRYRIEVIRADGSKEVVQANSRRRDALKRAAFITQDRAGWPSVVGTIVHDATGSIPVIAQSYRGA